VAVQIVRCDALCERKKNMPTLSIWRYLVRQTVEGQNHHRYPMDKVLSKDGTVIAYDRIGEGHPLILVDGAMCSRAFGPMPRLAPLLAKHFTVYMYDRRGRGDSGDNGPYAREREVEDVEALIRHAGGSAFVAGLSSGGALALEAAASGLPIDKLAVYEPPYMVGAAEHHTRAGHDVKLKQLIAENRRGDAVRYFMRQMVNVPAIFVALMQLMPGTWSKLKAIAHTLPYDVAVMRNFSLPAERLASITTPTLAMNGGKSDKRLQEAVQAVAKTVPNAQHRTLRGQTHNVKVSVLAPVLVEFFRS
jgi:pimeloyl-ACP methyl ester carboxylesterase